MQGRSDGEKNTPLFNTHIHLHPVDIIRRRAAPRVSAQCIRTPCEQRARRRRATGVAVTGACSCGEAPGLCGRQRDGRQDPDQAVIARERLGEYRDSRSQTHLEWLNGAGLIDIAYHSVRLQNFGTAFEILYGITRHSVSRLFKFLASSRHTHDRPNERSHIPMRQL